MREPNVPKPDLAGMLLISHPSLTEANFNHTVLYLSQADENGAFGMILNRPTGQTVGDIIAEKGELQAVTHVPVYLGGPVASDQLIFVAFTWNPMSERLECSHHLSPAKIPELANDPFTEVRAYIGYSGWGQGQLDRELAQGAWLVQAPVETTLAEGSASSLWKETVSTFGPVFRIAAEAPADPSRN